ncbi:hypothetical protein CISIN_1g037539mg, partial [Citrus sinensis]
NQYKHIPHTSNSQQNFIVDLLINLGQHLEVNIERLQELVLGLGKFFETSNINTFFLNTVSVTKSSDWFQVVAKLHSLKSLVLFSCALPPVNPSFIWHFNLSTSIETLDLSDNNLPSSSVYPWLLNLKAFQHMVSLKSLYLSDSELEGGIPKFFGNMCSLKKLRLSYNKLSGQYSQVIQNLSFGCVVNSLEGLYLRWNDFTGPIPHLGGFSSLEAWSLDVNCLNGTIDKSLSQLSKLESLSLDGNSLRAISLCILTSPIGISDSIPDWFWDLSNKLSYLNLSNNHFRGKLPDLSLRFDDLSSNLLSGGLPDCWLHFDRLFILNLANNRLSGKIPDSMGFLNNIWTLNLHNNRLTGKLPSPLRNFSQLRVLDLEKNAIFGEIPTWIGESLQNLIVLSLKSNKFHGNIPYQFENEYKSTLGLVRCLDLSSNKLDGAIPEEIMDLVGLIALNLSRNHLTGPITPKIGELTSLDFLDLSRNLFSGSIPCSLSQLSGLGVLDLSYNNLSGKIPSGTQLQSFNASVYAGNLELCGLPLANMCLDEESTPGPGTDDDSDTLEDEDDQFITLGFYVSSILSFFVGFWGVSGTLMLNRSWSYGYFNFLTGMKDWVSVISAVNISKLQRKFRN